MTPHTCPQECEVTRAARSGRWDETLRIHLATCAECREAAQVAQWMVQLARTAPAERPLPDPALMWIKSRLFGGQAVVEKVLQPVVFTERLAQGAVPLFAAGWLAWNWSKVESLAAGLSADAASLNFNVPMAASLPYEWQLTLLSLAAAAVCLLVVFSFRSRPTGS